jgi:NAD(P)-dependent dehydrogenase (short-subunit alcohol dehydrogenase family)
MNLGLNGRRALVTGASSGLGKAVAAALRAEGAAVGIVADLSAVNGVEPLLRQAIERLGGIDVLVVNTGGPPRANFDGVTDDMWRQAFEGLWIATPRSAISEQILERLRSMAFIAACNSSQSHSTGKYSEMTITGTAAEDTR